MPEGAPRLFPSQVATLGRLAAIVCQAPFASIFMADGGVICWCTGSNVLSAERVPRHDPFLTYLTREPGLLAIADLTNDPRFAQEDCVTGPLTVHAYAGVALRAADGGVKGALAVYDTVERRFVPRETEALLLVAQGVVALLEVEEHKALLETLLANLPLALIACDAQGRVTHYNREAAEMCSMDQNEFAPDGYSVRAGIYQADGVTPVGRADRPLARALRGEQVENMELVIIPEGAPERVTVCNGRRLVGLDGRFMGALCVSQDITERRRSELELERVHEQLRASARQAGMAEIATSILHNVGNVLTSINVCAALLGEGLRRSKAPDVGRVAALLREQGEKLGQFMTLDERGKVVPDYLQALAEQLLRDNEVALGHLATLRKSLEHVNHAVAMQQNYAKLTSVHETVSVVDLIEDSLRLTAGAFTRHGIELCRQFEPTPPITVDKHKVLQILVNLMRNAQSACDESGKKDKVLTLRLTGSGQGVRISVIDNGVGIAPENMSRLFTHGFTTRTCGHGFGLHSAVIAAQELGGSLHAESAGLGQGASFTLELPRDPPTAGS